jgi:HJR/Mrr/RecB family endonuclease
MVRERKIQINPIEITQIESKSIETKSIGMDEFVGQCEIKARLAEILDNSRKTSSLFPHLIVSGEKNSGRRTLALAIASEMGVKLEYVEASSIKQLRDFIPYLTNLEHGSLLVLNDVEKLTRPVLRWFESALRAFKIDVQLGEGANARTLELELQPFSCVSITSHPEKVGKEIVQFSIQAAFVPYTADEAIEIVHRKCSGNGIDLREGPKIAPALLKDLLVSVHCSTAEAMDLLRKAIAVSENTVTKKSFQLIGYSFNNLTDAITPLERRKEIEEMTGSQFETFVATLFSRKGYSVRMTPDSGDHGIDLRLTRSGKSGVVQCKRWTSIVGEKEIRDFFGAMCHEKAEFGFFVAGTEFSSRAREFSLGKNMALVDIHDLTSNPDWFI